MKRNPRRQPGPAPSSSLLARLTAVAAAPFSALYRALRGLTREENKVLLIAFVLALLIHLPLLAGLSWWFGSLHPEPDPTRSLLVDLWDRPSSDKKEEDKTPEEELEEYEPEEEPPEGQVVSVPKSKDTSPPPEDTKFLAEQDTRVEKESRSRIRMPGASSISAKPTLPGEGQEDKTQKGGMRSHEFHTMAPMESALPTEDEGEKPARVGPPPALEDINLVPTMESMASAISGTGLDHLEGVLDGDHTAVNAIGWKYASFFNRVKREIERYWHPDREFRRNDPYGNIYGMKDRRTDLLVVLRPDGSLKKVYIMSPSGVPFLDDEAKEAVEQAAPFPNVPLGLMDKNDRLVKFTFGFIVEVGRDPVLRIRRYR